MTGEQPRRRTNGVNRAAELLAKSRNGELPGDGIEIRDTDLDNPVRGHSWTDRSRAILQDDHKLILYVADK